MEKLAPPRVKFFHWLANLERCWTADRLARRGLPHPARCLLCDQAPESIHHLFLACPFSKLATPKPMQKGLSTATLLIPWMTWKHCNECVFDAATPSANTLIARIKDEAALWATAGARGFCVILPPSWDVH